MSAQSPDLAFPGVLLPLSLRAPRAGFARRLLGSSWIPWYTHPCLCSWVSSPWHNHSCVALLRNFEPYTLNFEPLTKESTCNLSSNSKTSKNPFRPARKNSNQLPRINLANGGSMQRAQVVTLKSGQQNASSVDAKSPMHSFELRTSSTLLRCSRVTGKPEVISGSRRLWPHIPFACLVALPPDRHPQSEDWELLCLPFCRFLAVSNGATQGQSIYLILRSPVEQKRAVPKEVIWYRIPACSIELVELSRVP
jgi:hypothetical protein